ncbi:hypothetical protein [Streptomyces flavofungini]|uniref:hypothetical protein n=1 Tax=Streptomyces flavofungini TaxID=68200 RepID=UPI0034DEEB95
MSISRSPRTRHQRTFRLARALSPRREPRPRRTPETLPTEHPDIWMAALRLRG